MPCKGSPVGPLIMHVGERDVHCECLASVSAWLPVPPEHTAPVTAARSLSVSSEQVRDERVASPPGSAGAPTA